MIQLEKHIDNRFPEYEVRFYTNRRNYYIHLGLDKSLFSFENYKSLLTKIDNFLNEHLSDTFIYINPSKLIFSTRWKHDYIVSRKKKCNSDDESKDLTREVDNNFIPKYVPGNLKWYEKDGLDTWYLRNKCEDVLKNTDLHFAKKM